MKERARERNREREIERVGEREREWKSGRGRVEEVESVGGR